jgi:hypothetical protein
LREVDALRLRRAVHMRYALTIVEIHALLQALCDHLVRRVPARQLVRSYAPGTSHT